MANPIQPMGRIPMPEMPTMGGKAPAGVDFQAALAKALEKVEGAQQNAYASVNRVLNGEQEEVHQAVLAVQQAELMLEMGLQVRNKVVQAYQEIMRMPL